MRKLIANFAKDTNGAVAVEYALLIALVAVAIAGALGTLNTDIKAVFTSVENQL